MRFQKRQTRVSGDVAALIALNDMKDVLLEEETDRDSVITALIASCTADLQNELGYYIDTPGFITQYYDAFTTRMYLFHRFIKSATADVTVEYLNDSHVWTTVSNTVYRIDASSNPPSIILLNDQEWPSPVDEESCVRINFKADQTHVAWNSFKQVIKEMVAESYESPEGNWRSGGMMAKYQRVIDLYKMRV